MINGTADYQKNTKHITPTFIPGLFRWSDLSGFPP
jgi:hypothetical protein